MVENTILIYEYDGRKAVEVLKHEFIDYIVSQVVEPYKEIGNFVDTLSERRGLQRKERVVEGLRKLV